MSECTTTGYPSIDKPWLKYYDEEAINARIPDCTVYQNIWENNREHLDEIALEYYGRKITYKKLFEQVERCAHALVSYGLKKGECAAFCVAGVPEVVYLLLACSRIGAIANFINPLFEKEQIQDRINDTKATLLFVLDKMYIYISDVISQTGIEKIVVIPAANSLSLPVKIISAVKEKPDNKLSAAMKTEAYVLWSDFIKHGAGNTKALVSGDAASPFVMVYSSGTTGASKGIVLTNHGINATLTQYKYMTRELSRQSRFLHIVPVWFSTGNVVCMLMPLYMGMTVILDPVFSPETFAYDLARFKPNFTLGATSLWLHSINYKPLQKMDLSFLIYPITGGEQLLSQTEDAINAFLREHNCKKFLTKGWGMCELGATVTTTTNNMTAEEYIEKQGSTGIPLPFVTVSAFDTDTGKELKYGERGELRVVSPSAMAMYYNNSAATELFFHTAEDGKRWGCTGDIGYVDEDGWVYVLGRTSDCYIAPDNTTVYNFDIENVILQDKAVKDCEVVDISINGITVPAAHMILNDTNSESIETVVKRVDENCRAFLEDYAVPAVYKCRTGFAVKPSGKRDTAALKAERDGFINADGETVIL